MSTFQRCKILQNILCHKTGYVGIHDHNHPVQTPKHDTPVRFFTILRNPCP